MSEIRCSACGRSLLPEDNPCPNCGSGDRQLFESDEGKGTESIAIREREQGFKRYVRIRKWVDKISGKTKQPTREMLEIDKMKRRKYHHVEEQGADGAWVVVHHENEPLEPTKE